jgi:hypothetical protein
MECKVFYSWQSDLPGSTNRSFIQDALEKAAKTIRKDESIKIAPVIVRDTQGLSGSPNIVTAIFDKIRECQVFVCDVSIINQSQEGKPTPNPNVLVELGYAIGLLGWERIILVMNSAYGVVEFLPFDLKMHTVTLYDLPNGEDKSVVRKELQGKLTAKLREILAMTLSLPPELPSFAEQAIEAIENCQLNAPVLTRKYLAWLVEELDRLFPEYKQDRLDILLTAPDDPTQFLVSDFARFSEAIAVTSNFEIAKIVYDRFDSILERYAFQNRDSDRDFYKFIGHELFVSFLSPFILKNEFEILSKLLILEWHIQSNDSQQDLVRQYTFISECSYCQTLEKKDGTLSHADVLNKRHSEGSIVKFPETEFFLFLRQTPTNDIWYFRSISSLEKIPPYLSKAGSINFATQLFKPLNVPDISALRELVKACIDKLQNHEESNPVLRASLRSSFDPQTIGSRE